MVLRSKASLLGAAGLMMVIGVILALMMLAAPPASAHAGYHSAGHEHPRHDEQIERLGAAWWQWALQKPTPINPQVGSYSGGPKCNGSSVRGVWFLAGSYNGAKVVRHCTMPVGRKLFFPIVNVFDADPKGVFKEKQYRQCVNSFMDQTLKGSTTYATVDGKRVSGEREDTPVFRFNLPKNNLYGAPSGPYLGVADGLWVLLPPLSKGEHTIRFGGNFPNAPTGGCLGGGGPFKQNNTYKLRVVSETH